MKFYIVLLLLFVGCNKNIQFEEFSNYNLILVSGNDQIGLQNMILFEDIVVKVEDDLGASVANAKLNIKVISGEGNLNSGESIFTNEDGIATISWKLGLSYNNTIEISSSLNETSSVLINAIAKYNYMIPQENEDGWKSSEIDGFLTNKNTVFEGIDEIRKGNYKEIHSVLLSINDKLVLEEYFSGTNSFGQHIDYDRVTPHELQSVNKTFRGAILGIAIDKGFIDNDKEPLYALFPDLDYLSKNGKEEILLEHLLDMSSGLEWNEGTDLGGFYNTPFSTAHTYVLSKSLENVPGTVFEYNTGTSFVLNRIVMNAIDVDFEFFARNNYSVLVESEALPGTGEPLDFRNTPRDMLKLGQVYLNNGKWKNVQVISKAWVDKSTIAHQNVSTNSSYGYQWWIRDFNVGEKKYNCYYAAGYGGQFIFVIKELNLVAVFTGGNFNSKKSIPIEMMENYILPAF
ncbi:serine hydrolase domain-containing protein [Thalassobellus citreus]|uniref:serine hydrolase domain-containing protein n=1 Tax=Thalassobellus citreus TaxID=3367752 RepID=UPI00378AD1B6